VVLAAGVAGSVALAGAAQQEARWSGRWPEAVGERWTVALVGTTASVPVPTRYGGTCRFLLGVDTVHARGVTTAAATTVRVEAPCQHLAPMSRVEVTGRLASVPAGRATAVLRASTPVRVLRDPPAWSTVADRTRVAGTQASADLPSPLDALLPGIVWGDTSRMDDELLEQMRVTGLTHITAVSGAHFVIVVSTVLMVTTAMRLPRPARAAAAATVSVGLVVLVGPEPSVLRAAVMGGVGLLGLLAGRRSAAPAALAGSVVFLVLVDPWLATELGFTLSVAATAGIVGLGGPLVERWSRRVPRALAVAVAVPLSAQLAVTPVLLEVTPAVPTYAVVANLLAAPTLAPVTVLGMLGLVVVTWWPAAGQVLFWLAGAACAWIVLVARLVATAPGSTVDWLPGPLGVVTGTGAVVAVMVLLSRPSSRTGRAGQGDAP